MPQGQGSDEKEKRGCLGKSSENCVALKACQRAQPPTSSCSLPKGHLYPGCGASDFFLACKRPDEKQNLSGHRPPFCSLCSKEEGRMQLEKWLKEPGKVLNVRQC